MNRLIIQDYILLTWKTSMELTYDGNAMVSQA